ncbi:MAG: protein kinase [Anaerolineae bacterium]
MPLEPDKTILNGKYHIERILGEGGMARVWLAKEPAFHQRLVAIKEPRADLSADVREEVSQRYQREIMVCAALDGARVPHMVRALTAELLEDQALLVLEYMPGGDLETLLQANPHGLPLAQAIAIVRAVLGALQAAHGHPLEIVHRDVKPSNILFDGQGRAYLADFGLAQVADGSDLTKLGGGIWRGTGKYAAPEQVAGTGYLTPAADIYAVGAVLFEAVTGKPYKQQPPNTRASKLRRDVPPALDQALSKALAEQPADRFQSAQEFAEALSKIRLPTKTTPLASLRKWLIPAALLIQLSVAGIWLWTRPKPPVNPPETETAVSTVPSTTAITVSPTLTPVTPTATSVPLLPVMAGTPVPSPGEAISVTNASRIVQLARWGQGVANWVAYAPDGKTMAVASSLGVYLYDVQTRTPVRLIETEYPVNGLIFSLDGSEVATWSSSVTDVGRWRVSDGGLIERLVRLSGSAQFIYASDGSILQLVQSGDNSLRVQNLGKGQALWFLSLNGGTFAVSPDGQAVATTRCYDRVRPTECEKAIVLWRTTSRQQTETISPALDASIVGFRFAPDRRFLAAWLNDGTIRIWSLLDKVWLPNRFTGVSGVLNLTFSANDSLVAFGTTAGGVYLWRVADGKVLLATLVGWPVNTVTFSPDGTKLAAATRDAVRMWDVATLAPELLEGFAAQSLPSAVSPVGDTIATVLTNTIVLRSLSDGSMVSTFHGHQGAITTLAFAPDGKSLASGSVDDTVRVWNVASGATSLIVAHLADIRSVAFSPGGDVLGVVTADNTARIWRLGNGTVADVFTNSGDRISALAFAPDADRVALGSCREHENANDLNSRCRSGRVWLPRWSADGKSTAVLELKEPSHGGYVDAFAFAPQGNLLATAARAGGDTHIWQLGEKASLLAQIGITATSSLVFSPDGQILATGSGGRVIQLWRMPDGALLFTLVGHTDDVTQISFTADGRRIISSSEDGTIRLWGIPPFEPVTVEPKVSATTAPVGSPTPAPN